MKEGFAKYKKMIILLILLGVAMLLYVVIDNIEQSVVQDSYNPIDLSSVNLTELDDSRISLTVPKEYVYEATQEQLDETARIQGYESITLGEDGTATYIMTADQYTEMISTLKEQSKNAINALSGTTDYTDLESVEINDDFNEFTVQLSTDGTRFDSQKIIATCRSYASMVAAFDGKNISQVTINVVDVNGKTLVTYTDTPETEAGEEASSEESSN